MFVFISWSGEKSKEIAIKIKSWLPNIIQEIEPWMSEDIRAGSRWSPEIAEKLSQSELGIICVTPDNLKSEWLQFEAGAISKQLNNDTKVCPILYDVKPSELDGGPLSQFQAVVLGQDGEGILKLVSSLNEVSDFRLPSDVIEILFEHHWPRLRKDIFGIEEISYSTGDNYNFYIYDERNFFRELDYSKITSIDILAHTGEELIREFFEVLEKNVSFQDKLIENKAEIKMLLRDPTSEISDRVIGIQRTCKKILNFKRKGLQLYLHFYQNLPVLRAIKCKLRDSDTIQKGLITYYYFPSGGYSKKYDQIFLIDEKKGIKNQMSEITDSWFQYYWGKTLDNETHTIIFDFDDTIVSSHDIQIEAWIQLIREAIDNYQLKPNNFCKEVDGLQLDKHNHQVTISDEDKLKTYIQQTFFTKQEANVIFDSIFSNLPYDLKDKLHQLRFRIRQEKMKTNEVEPFPNMQETIKELSKNYNLVIISGTDEEVIKDHLSKPEFKTANSLYSLYSYFKYIFGKKEPDFQWENIDKKIQLIHKITSIVGIPVERMIYVGDSDRDFKASRTINIDFIEARLISKEIKKIINKESLINYDNEIYFTHWREFQEILNKVENNKKLRRQSKFGF